MMNYCWMMGNEVWEFGVRSSECGKKDLVILKQCPVDTGIQDLYVNAVLKNILNS